MRKVVVLKVLVLREVDPKEVVLKEVMKAVVGAWSINAEMKPCGERERE